MEDRVATVDLAGAVGHHWGLRRTAEIVLIGLVFFVQAGWPPPDVNEAHYLAKLKHFWDSQWCPGDAFLKSATAHGAFAWTCGWWTRYASLPVVAWLGRLLTWGLLAWSWYRLSWTIVPRFGVALLTGGLAVALWQYGHMSGEWVVGGFEAKGIAYALNFLAIGDLLRHRYGWACIGFGAATAVHVLVGGWAFLAAGLLYGWDRWIDRSATRAQPPPSVPWGAVLGAIALALCGVWPALGLNTGVASETVELAEIVYVHRRLPHHLVFTQFPWPLIARHLGLVCVWAALVCALNRQSAYRRLTVFIWGTVLISTVGAVLSLVLGHDLGASAQWLRFYWHRLSDVMVPVGVAIGCAAWIEAQSVFRPSRAAWAMIAAIGVATSLMGYHIWQRSLPPATHVVRHDDSTDWRRVCRWIADNTPPNARVFTPISQRTFKWYAQRSEVVTWKDIPQDAAGIAEWWQRFQRAKTFRRRLHEPPELIFGELQSMAEDYQFQYVLVSGFSPRPTWCGQPVVYADGGYLVVRLMSPIVGVGPCESGNDAPRVRRGDGTF